MNVDVRRLDQLKIDRSDDTPKNRGPIVAAAIVIAAVIALLTWYLLSPEVPVVKVAPATSIDAGGKLTVLNASGYVTARRQATVSSKVTGKVTEVMVEEGMQVKKGQLLARLDASLTGAAARLAEAQARAAEKNLEETRVRIREAKLEHDRVAKLVRDSVASQSELDRAAAQLDSLQARLVAQQEELAVARRQLGLRSQEVDDMEIRAPFDGIVIAKNAQPGEMISPMSAGGGYTRTGICTIVDMESLEIEVDVNEAYITRVQSNQPVEATLDAYPDWQIPAHVITTIPAADREKATVRVRIGFDQKDPRILPDMGVKVAFIGGEGGNAAKPAVTVPRTALRRDGETDVVFVLKGEKVERRAVRVSASEGANAQLLSGVSAGEQVVVEGPAELEDGATVRIEE